MSAILDQKINHAKTLETYTDTETQARRKAALKVMLAAPHAPTSRYVDIVVGSGL